MSRPPFDALAESYLEDRFGIIEGSVMFASGEVWDYGYGGESFSRNVFEVHVSGSYPTGAGFSEVYEDGAAVEFLDHMFTWRGDS